MLCRFPEKIPQSNINGADGHHPNPLTAEREGFAIHVLPEKLDVPRILLDQQWLEVKVDCLLCKLRSQSRIAYAYKAVVTQDFDHEPSMKGERAHGRLRQFQKVHGVGAEVRRQRGSLASPAEDSRANLFDLHCAP